MGRAIYAPTPEISKIGRVVGLNEGGTGGSTASDAVANLGGLSTVNMGQPNGLLGLESNGRILPTLTDGLVAPTVSLTGKSTIVSRTSYTYKINNYDSATSYVVSVSAGTVSIVDDVITLRAPVALGNITLTVNTESFTLEVVSNRLLTPTITAPSNDVSNIGDRLRVISSAAVLTGSTEIGKLMASDGVAGDKFGTGIGVSYDGSTLIIGANGTDGITGAAYIYKWNGVSWVETKLMASDGVAGDNFGFQHDVNYDGSTVFVSAMTNNNINGVDAGAVYIYKWNGTNWIETKLMASDGVTGDRFGSSLSTSNDGNTIVTGSRLDDNVNGADAGAAYIYKFDGTNWVETKLIASDGAASDNFGWSVSISSDGNTVAVGAYVADNTNGANAGAVYIYKFDGTNWIETKLIASDGATHDQFGISCSVNATGSIIAVGARYSDNVNGTNAGAVYVNVWNGVDWNETTILASDGGAGDEFGFHITMNDAGDVIYVGANLDDDNGVDSGSSYVYKFDGANWIETKLLASDGVAGDLFGWRVAISGDGNNVISGAYAHNVLTGAAYIYNPVFHEQTQYQVSVDPNFSTIIEDVTVNGNVTDYTLPNLSPANAYYVRLRYKSNVYGFTDWSNIIHLNTRLEFIPDKEVYKLIASDGAANEQLGFSVDLSDDGNTIVGSVRLTDTVNGVDVGSVSVFKFNGTNWVETKLLASDGAAGDEFGWGVSISSDASTIVAGALFDDNVNGVDAGAIYVYKFDGTNWVETKLMASDGAAGDEFGRRVAVNSDGSVIATVALLNDNVNGADAGAAYIYKFDGTSWIETKLIASDGAANDGYGWSININETGNVVVVGSVYSDTPVIDAGAAYIYKFDGANWIETKLIASDGVTGDYLGTGISVNGDGTIIVVGAHGADNTNGVDAGAAYIYKFDGTNWIETKLIASDGVTNFFGSAVEIDLNGTVIFVSSRRDDINGVDAGAVYIYKFDGTNWIETKLLASDGAAGDEFGIDMKSTNDASTLVVGAYGDDNVIGVDAGAIYVFRS